MHTSDVIMTKTMQISFTQREDNLDTHLGIEAQMCYNMDKTCTHSDGSETGF